MLFFV